MKRIVKYYTNFAGDSLYGNSIYLMLSTAIMAILGFFFWVINARIYSAEQVGLATTLISIMTLISTFSLLGLGNSLIRYLPTSLHKIKMINTTFSLVGLTSLIIGLIFLIGIKIFSPPLLFVQENFIYSVLFIVFVVFSSLAVLVDFVFIAYRSASYVLVKNTLFSIAKLIFPVFLISLGAYGIYMSVGIATILAVILSFGILVWRFNYIIRPTVDSALVKKMFNFSLGNYAAGFIGGLPQLVLPILIINLLGAKFSAYFYMDIMIASLLYIIPMAVSQSLFAEGSYSEAELKDHLRRAIKIISILIVPGILITFFFGNYILLAFGENYSNEGILLLRLFALSAIFVSINYLGNAILFIKYKIRLLFLVNLIGTLIIFSLSYVLIDLSLLGIGIAWIVGQGVVSFIYLLFIKKIL